MLRNYAHTFITIWLNFSLRVSLDSFACLKHYVHCHFNYLRTWGMFKNDAQENILFGSYRISITHDLRERLDMMQKQIYYLGAISV
jgi:hypothetical protein